MSQVIDGTAESTEARSKVVYMIFGEFVSGIESDVFRTCLPPPEPDGERHKMIWLCSTRAVDGAFCVRLIREGMSGRFDDYPDEVRGAMRAAIRIAHDIFSGRRDQNSRNLGVVNKWPTPPEDT